jgi:deoxyribodipyrimidine photo-lyase
VIKTTINIVWFKRDLRFIDNDALFCAELRVTFIICLFFEPTVMNYEDSDVRHWRFIYESVQDLQDKLNPTNSKLYFFHSEVQPVLQSY